MCLDRYSICVEKSVRFVHLRRLLTILTCVSKACGLVRRRITRDMEVRVAVFFVLSVLVSCTSAAGIDR